MQGGTTMKQQSKRRVSLLLTFIMLLSIPAVGLAEPTVIVEQQPSDFSDELPANNASPVLVPSAPDGQGNEGGEGDSSSGEPLADLTIPASETLEETKDAPSAPLAPQIPSTLTLVSNSALPTALPLDGQGSGTLGRIFIQESFPSLEGISWRLSEVTGSAVTLAVQPVSGSPSADIKYSGIVAAGEVTYDLTCALAGVTGSLRITVRVTDTRPTSIGMPSAVYSAVSGAAVALPAPTPLPDGSAFPQGTEFFAELSDGSKVALNDLSFAEAGEYAVNVAAKFGETTLKAPVTVTVMAEGTNPETPNVPMTAQANLTLAVNPTSIYLTPASTTVLLTKTTQLRATVYPVTAAQTVEWSSSDEAIATVSDTGLVTGVAEGTITITATSTVISTLKATCRVTVVPIAVTSVKVAAPVGQSSVAVGGEVALTATVLPAEATHPELDWSSSNPAVFSVDSSGNARALNRGMATITAATRLGQGTYGTIVRGTITLTAVDAATSVAITGKTSGLMLGKTASIKANILPSTASQKVNWTSSDPTVVSVIAGSISATIKALSVGTATITATTMDGTDLEDSFEVKVAPGAQTMRITKGGNTIGSASIDLNEGNTLQLGCVVEPDDANQDVIWSITSYYGVTVATIDQNGLVTANNAGKATIMARAADGSGKSISIPLSVDCYVNSIVLSGGGVTSLAYGQYLQLTATLLPANATDKTLIWSSSNENVATVYNGRVTPKRVASATEVTITAAAKTGGATGSYNITVYPVPTSIILTVDGVEKSTAFIDISSSSSLQLAARVVPEDASQEIVWSPTIGMISVDSSGNVTASGAGSAVIRATAKGSTSVYKTITITAGYAVEEITVNGPSSLAAGKTTRLTADVSPSAATNKTLTWSVDRPDLATIVATTGQLTALAGKSGDIVVTATAKDGSGVTGTLNVKITPVATSMKIFVNGEEKTTAVMDLAMNVTTLQLSAVISPDGAGQGVTWTSSRPVVAKVNADTGLVEAMGTIGSTVITAQASDGSLLKKTVTINVCRAVQSVTIYSKDNATTVPSRKTLALWAVVSPDNATTQALKWSSSNASIATVTSSTLASGTATVTAGSVTETKEVEIYAETTDGSGIKAAFTITVLPLASSVVISGPGGVQTIYGLDIGGSDRTMQLSAEVLPAAANQEVIWSSSLPSVATVDKNGLVKGVASGKTTISATANDGSLRKASVTVNVAVMTTSIAFLNTETEMLGTETLQLRTKVLPLLASQTLTWTSSDTTAATISTGGLITAKAVQEAKEVTFTCKATDGSNTYAEYSLTILPKPATLKIYADGTAVNTLTVDLAEGTKQLEAAITPSLANQDVSWLSSNSDIVSVDASGALTIKKLGTVTITATSKKNNALKATLGVTVQSWATSVTISAANGADEIAIGQTLGLTAKLLPAGTTTTSVTWASDDTSVATVASSGLLSATVTAKAVGTVTLTATAKDKIGGGVYGTYVLQINPKATSVVISSADGNTIDLASLPLVDTLQLSAVVEPQANVSQVVEWSSSNVLTAKVGQDGLVQGLKVGSVTITARAKDGSNKSGIFTVNVVAQPTAVEITGKNQLLPGGSTQLTANVLPSAVVNKSVKWSTTDTNYITVGSTGIVTVRSTPLNGGTWPATLYVNVRATSAIDAAVYEDYEIYIAPRATTLDILRDGDIITTTSVYSNDVDGFALEALANDPSKTFTWKSSVPSIVKVTRINGNIAKIEVPNAPNGVAGKATITATADDGSGLSKSITVIVINANDPAVGIKITPPLSTELSSGKSVQLSVIFHRAEDESQLLNPSDKTIVWTSDDPATATVSSSGLVIAKPVDFDTTVTIWAKAVGCDSVANDGILTPPTASITFTVKPSAKTLTISTGGKAPTIDLNALYPNSPTLALTAECTPVGSGGVVSWSSSNTTVARVSADGIVTGFTEGTTIITAIAGDNASAKDTITITVKRLIRTLSIGGLTEVAVGNKITLSAIIAPSAVTSKDVIWSLDPDTIVTQNEYVSIVKSVGTVVVTGLREGSNIAIYCKAAEGTAAMATHYINVLQRTTALSIYSETGNNTIDLNTTSVLQLYLHVTPASASPEVAWSTSSGSIATVDQTGKVTALNPGKVTIRATTKDGTNITASFEVLVIRAATSVTVKSNNGQTKIIAGRSLVLSATVLPVSATDKSLVWTHDGDQDDIKIATVSGAVTVIASAATEYHPSLTVTATNPTTGISGSIVLSVTPLAESIAVSVDGTPVVLAGNPIIINLNDIPTRLLMAEVSPAGASTTINWSSNNPAIATVIGSGTGQAVLTGLAVGTAYITAGTSDGSGAQFAFRVQVVRQ